MAALLAAILLCLALTPLAVTDQWLAKHGATIMGFAVVAFALFSQRDGKNVSPRSIALRTQFFVTNTRLVVREIRRSGAGQWLTFVRRHTWPSPSARQ